jgi:ATP-dependent DNA helicase RecQ
MGRVVVSPPVGSDATELGLRVLRTVDVTRQRFGMDYLIDILVGKKTPTVIHYRHEHLDLFGSGKVITRKRWSLIFRRLLAEGYLKSAATGFGALRLSERGLAVLKEEAQFSLENQSEPRRERSRFLRPVPSRFDPKREHMYHALKERLSAIARSRSIAADSVLPDAVVAEIVRQRPNNLKQLKIIPGITESKARLFGEELLEVLAAFRIDRVAGNLR